MAAATMDCGRFEELASEYVEGILPAPLAHAVDVHLQTCARCAADLETLKVVWRDLDVLPEVDPPLFFHENVMTAIEREATVRRGWRALLPQLARVGFSTAAVCGVVAAVAYTLLLPTGGPPPERVADIAVRRPTTLPGARATSTGAPAAQMVVSRPRLTGAAAGPAYTFTVRLMGLNGGDGLVQFHALPSANVDSDGPADVRRMLGDNVPLLVTVPVESLDGDTVNLSVSWSANGLKRNKRLFVPLNIREAGLREIQSFGLPRASLAATAREVAARYGVPVTVEDVGDIGPVTVYAREETARQALTRALEGQGVRVTESEAGLLVEPETRPTTVPSP